MPIYGQYAPQQQPNPLDMGLQAQPQVDILAQLEEEKKRKQEEEDRRRKEAQALIDNVMKQAQQQQEPPEMDEAELLKKIMARRFTPEREERLKQLRSETPESIARRMQDQYWGTPTSKLGKIGTVALKIASGALGAQTPDFRKEAVNQWIQKNKIAGEEESSEGRLAAAELSAVSRQNVAARRAQTDSQKSLYTLTGKMVDGQLKQLQMEQQQKMDAAKMTGMDLDQKKKEFDLEMAQKVQALVGPLAGLLKLDPANVGGVVTALEGTLSPEVRDVWRKYAGSRLSIAEGLEQNKQYKPPTPDRVVNATRNQIVVDPNTGSKFMQAVPNSRTIPGRPGQGEQNAGSRAFLQGTGPLMPQQSQQVQQQPAPMAQPQQIFPQVQPIQPTKPPVGGDSLPSGVPMGSREITPEIRAVGSAPSTTRYRAFVKEPDNIILQGPGNKDITRDDKANLDSLKLASVSNSTIRDAYLNGDLDKISGTGRAIMAGAGLPDRWISSAYKIKGDTQKIETAIQRVTLEQTAAYLKKMSGAQVSDAEFQRVREMFPQTANLPDNNLQLAYWNTLVPTVMLMLDQAGAVTPQTVSRIFESVGNLAKSYTKQYLMDMKDIRAKGNSKEVLSKYDLNVYNDFDKIATQALRMALPEAYGKTVPIQHSDQRFGSNTSYIHIPAETVKVGSDDESKKPAKVGPATKTEFQPTKKRRRLVWDGSELR